MADDGILHGIIRVSDEDVITGEASSNTTDGDDIVGGSCSSTDEDDILGETSSNTSSSDEDDVRGGNVRNEDEFIGRRSTRGDEDDSLVGRRSSSKDQGNGTMGSRRSRDEEWVRSVKNNLNKLAEEKKWGHQVRSTIFRVRPQVRRLHPDMYSPALVYLGLFHSKLDVLGISSRSDILSSWTRGDISKTKGERVKLEMANAFLETVKMSVHDWDDLCDKVVDKPEDMQKLYGREHEYQSTEVVKCALTLDAIFITSYLYTNLFLERYGNDFPFPSLRRTIFGEADSTSLALVSEDIIKLENQIPLSLMRKVLAILFSRTGVKTGPYPTGDMRPDELAEVALKSICMGVVISVSTWLPGFHSYDDALQYAWLGKMPDAVDKVAERKGEHLLGCLCRVMRQGMKPSQLGDSDKRNVSIPSATKLHAAGIDFRGVARDIFHLTPKFKTTHMKLKATLEIPIIILSSNATEIIWRNVVAYELGSSMTYQPFTMFMKFMDELIDTKHDVWLLRQGDNPVIRRNSLGAEKDAARVFNTMVQNCVVYDSQEFLDLRIEILDFYNEKLKYMKCMRRRSCIELWRKSFGKSWLMASFLAAVVLLSLTFLQTLYTLIEYYPHDRHRL